MAASPAAPAVSAKLPVFAASRSAAVSESAAAAELFEDDPAAEGLTASDAPVVPAAASSTTGSEESGGAAAAVGVTGKIKRKGDQESSEKNARKSGVALPRPPVRLAREGLSARKVGKHMHF